VPDQKTLCPEKQKLSEAIVKAVNAVYTAKNPKDKTTAQAAELNAIAALDTHRKKHKC
jgi:hypothetical protein